MISISTIIVIANLITLVLGGFICLLGCRAYRRTGATALRALAVGFGLVTVGTAIGGLLHQFTPVEFIGGVALQSLFVAAGFAILAYSLSNNVERPALRSRWLSRQR